MYLLMGWIPISSAHGTVSFRVLNMYILLLSSVLLFYINQLSLIMYIMCGGWSQNKYLN